jgi:phosphate transport system permease protein
VGADPLTGRLTPVTLNDKRAELMLGALACVVLIVILVMVISVVTKAWPSFSHNGLGWFGSGPSVDHQLADIFNSPAGEKNADYKLNAWPLLYGTALITGGALILGIVFALLSAIFIVEFAPRPLQRVLEPVVRLLAAVPSVIYGLIGVLVLVPFVGNHLISTSRKESVIYVVQLSGGSLLVAVLILTVMITPIMVALIVVALRAVPVGWREGSAALGVNRWRTVWTISVRAIRPAIIAAAVLASARALGEAIMLSMVSGSVGFAPNPLDGLTFFFEPARPLAAAIVEGSEGFSVKPYGETLYAFGAILLLSSLVLSLGAHYAKRPLRRFGLTP